MKQSSRTCNEPGAENLISLHWEHPQKKPQNTHSLSSQLDSKPPRMRFSFLFFFLFSHPSPKNSRCSALLSGSPVWILIWMQTHSEDAQRADICAFSLLTFFYFSSPLPLPPHASTEPRACLSFRGGRVGGFPFFFFVFRTHTHTRAREEDGVSPECLQRSFL